MNLSWSSLVGFSSLSGLGILKLAHNFWGSSGLEFSYFWSKLADFVDVILVKYKSSWILKVLFFDDRFSSGSRSEKDK